MGVGAGVGERTGAEDAGYVDPIECGEAAGLACECAKHVCLLMRDAD